MRNVLWINLLLLTLTGVAAAQVAMIPADRFRSWTADGVDLSEFTTYYVVKEADDEAALDILIVDALLELGLEATSGEAEDMPAESQAKVTYESWYQESRRRPGVTDLVMFIRHASTNQVIAVAEMEKVQDFPGPETIATAINSLLDETVESAELPIPVSELTKSYTARMRDPEGSIPEFRANGEVTIVNAQPSFRWPLIFPNRIAAKKEYVDFQQLLEVATDALGQHIRDAGAAIAADGGEKTITLEITDYANIAIIQTYINFTVRTGDGYVQGLQASGKHWNYRRSADDAVADIAVQVLNDPAVIAYLEQ